MVKRPRHAFKRTGPRREAYDRVLIVCEGSKTEPAYLQELITDLHLSTANVVVAGSGSDPLMVVRHAKKLRRHEQKYGEKYDQVYCVFDHDEHPSFDRACSEARTSGLKLARSWPCFEFWLLLHFQYSRKPYTRSGERSPAENCISDLRKYMPNYAKAASGLHQATKHRLNQAKVNASRALADAKETEQSNPSTEMHELINYLQSLKVPTP